jgi:hypothetical protein
VNLVVAARVGGGAAAFLVAEAGVEAGCLEGVGTQGQLIAAAPGGLLLRRGEQPGAQARPTVVAVYPEKFDVAASAPRPPEQPAAEVTAVFAGGDAKQPDVVIASRRDVERVDFGIQTLSQTVLDYVRSS